MKTFLKIAVLIAGLVIGLTACENEEKQNLLSDIEKTRSEFLAVDSSLTGLQQIIQQRKDSLLQISSNDSKQKVAIDSLIETGEDDVVELNEIADKHKVNSKQLDSLKDNIGNNVIEISEAKAKWENLKAEHVTAKDYADKSSIALLMLIMAEKKDSVPSQR